MLVIAVVEKNISIVTASDRSPLDVSLTFPLNKKSLDNQLIIKALCFKLVGATGFEPATPWSQTKCATNCATPLTDVL